MPLRTLTPNERALWCSRGFNPDLCNWCDAVLADDPDPEHGNVIICSACVKRADVMREAS